MGIPGKGSSSAKAHRRDRAWEWRTAGLARKEARVLLVAEHRDRRGEGRGDTEGVGASQKALVPYGKRLRDLT